MYVVYVHKYVGSDREPSIDTVAPCRRTTPTDNSVCVSNGFNKALHTSSSSRKCSYCHRELLLVIPLLEYWQSHLEHYEYFWILKVTILCAPVDPLVLFRLFAWKLYMCMLLGS